VDALNRSGRRILDVQSFALKDPFVNFLEAQILGLRQHIKSITADRVLGREPGHQLHRLVPDCVIEMTIESENAVIRRIDHLGSEVAFFFHLMLHDQLVDRHSTEQINYSRHQLNKLTDFDLVLQFGSEDVRKLCAESAARSTS
jgi:hypothetical protein